MVKSVYFRVAISRVVLFNIDRVHGRTQVVSRCLCIIFLHPCGSDAATKAIIEAANTERGSAQQFVIDSFPSREDALFVQPDAEGFVKTRLKTALDSFYGASGSGASGALEGGPSS